MTAPVSTADQRRLQRRWYWNDLGVTGYLTVTITVLLGPYLTTVANAAACPDRPTDQTCLTNLHVLGVPVAPGSLVPYTLTAGTILAAVLLVLGGALADRSPNPARLLMFFASLGSVAAMALALVAGTNWPLGVVLAMTTTICIALGMSVYNAIMVRITPAEDRDRVSSTGWAFGYLGGAILLVVALVLLGLHSTLGLTTTQTVRLIFFISGLWWAVFAWYAATGLTEVRGTSAGAPLGATIASGLAQLRATFGEMRSYPQTFRFLVAFLLYNDGIQTVITSASLFGSRQLGFSDNQLVITILWVQIIAFGGALSFARFAARFGAQRTILGSLVAWTGVVTAAFFVPRGSFEMWLVLATGIGVVLGGSQSLSRSLFSHLIPPGEETKYFSLYQAMERGTSWFGTLLFGLVFQWFHDYRWSILALIVFFVGGGAILRTVDVGAGIRAVGNQVPSTLRAR